jgi:hypothetical protein
MRLPDIVHVFQMPHLVFKSLYVRYVNCSNGNGDDWLILLSATVLHSIDRCTVQPSADLVNEWPSSAQPSRNWWTAQLDGRCGFWRKFGASESRRNHRIYSKIYQWQFIHFIYCGKGVPSSVSDVDRYVIIKKLLDSVINVLSVLTSRWEHD